MVKIHQMYIIQNQHEINLEELDVNGIQEYFILTLQNDMILLCSSI